MKDARIETMTIRTSTFSVTHVVAPKRTQTNAPRKTASRATVPPPAPLPPTSGEELVRVLVAAGGRVLARQAHGVLLDVRRRLVFVPPSRWVSDATVADALRAAAMTRERFLELRHTSG
jgi:hypothetical protein